MMNTLNTEKSAEKPFRKTGNPVELTSESPLHPRRKSHRIMVGSVPVGGGAPISVQSMTNTLTANVPATLQQIAELTAAGCDIVRVAVPSQDDADALPEICRKSPVPIIADIHFQSKYVFQAIDAGCAFVNALPVFIASDPVWAKKFEDAGLPIVGDDIKSQVGATITHRVMAKLFEDRGVRLERTMQLNVGGNMDFKNMLERERLESKKISKTQAVTSNLHNSPIAGKREDRNVHIGPSDYVEWLDDRKWAYVRLEGSAFGEVPLNLEYKLEVWDSPNSAGIIIDAVRAAKIALDRGVAGPVLAASSYLMKSPPVQKADDVARAELEGFIAGN